MQNKTPTSALRTTLAAVALLAGASAASADQSLADLKKQLDALHERATNLEANREVRNAETRRRVAAAAAVEPGDKPTSIKIPGTNTSLQVGGFVRLDGIWDLSAGGVGLDTANAALAIGGTGIGSYNPALNQLGAAFNCGIIPFFGTQLNTAIFCQPGVSRADNRLNGGNFRLHGRLSRFWFKTSTPTDFGELNTHIATDFLNTNEAGGGILRLRQAFGSLGPVTAGLLESTFRPTFAESETLDFGGTVGYAAVRRAQIRYTHNFGANTALSLAAEDPGDSIADADIAYSSELNSAGNRARLAAQRIPDFVAAASHRFPQGQIWLAGILRHIEHDTGGEPYAATTGLGQERTSHDSKWGWGFAAAGTYDITPRFAVGAHGFVGRGIGSYVGAQGDNSGGQAAAGRVVLDLTPIGLGIRPLAAFITPTSAFHDAVIIGPGQIRTIWSYGGFVWGRYQFTDTMRTNVAFGYARQDMKRAFSNWRGGQSQALNGAPLDSSNRKNFLVGNVDYMYSIHGNVIWSPVPQVDFGVEYVHLFVARFKGEHPFYFFANDRNALISRIVGMMMYRF